MSIVKILNPAYRAIVSTVEKYRAYIKRKKSEYQLAQLDDHLLDDIGMKRQNEKVVPIHPKRRLEARAIQKRRHARSKHAYLLRRRQE